MDFVRGLFASEARCVSNLFKSKWDGAIRFPSAIVCETIAPPGRRARKPLFNCDFILDFVDRRAFVGDRSAAAWSVLPNALGAEVFLIVEKATLYPTALELNGGGAFPIKYFSAYIDRVEAVIKVAAGQRQFLSVLADQAVRSIHIRQAAFARVLIVGSDITFLYFPNETTPVMGRGEPHVLAAADDRHIGCYLDRGEVVCFDGWIRTEVAASEEVLVATQDESEAIHL